MAIILATKEVQIRGGYLEDYSWSLARTEKFTRLHLNQ
jgi:hypothetical protein